MAKRDPERTRKIRVAVRYLLEHNCLHKGNQTRIAEHFQVSRQRVHQIVVEERNRRGARVAVTATTMPPQTQMSEMGALVRVQTA